MPARPEDDFSVFAGSEQMFFGLRDPFGMIRDELEEALRQQVPDTDVVSIAALGQPKYLTLGRRGDGDAAMLVTHFAFCFQAKLSVLFDQGRKGEVLDATLTFMFSDVDVQGSERVRTHFDLHADAAGNFDDEVFKQRFLAFRSEDRPETLN